MKYHIRIGDEQLEVSIDGETVTVDGTSVQAHIEDLPGTPLQLLTIGREVHSILARRGSAKGQYDISLSGYRFAIEALDERSKVIRELSDGANRPARPAHLVAPMPGLIVRVSAKAGDRVRAGQGLVVMEAMKMENELRASADGTVKRVLAVPGGAVEKGAILLEMEG